MEQPELIKLQLKSLLIVHYISYFAKIENLVKQIFQKRVVEQDHKYKSKLYFMYGSVVGNDIYYDIDNECLALVGNRRYNDAELFKELSLNKIVKFDRKECIISEFRANIDSIQTKSLSFTFHDSVIKFINMRNKLAHELNDISFNDKDVVERLSSSYIKQDAFEWLEGLDVTMMDNGTIAIYSNLIYINKILEQLPA